MFSAVIITCVTKFPFTMDPRDHKALRCKGRNRSRSLSESFPDSLCRLTLSSQALWKPRQRTPSFPTWTTSKAHQHFHSAKCYRARHSARGKCLRFLESSSRARNNNLRAYLPSIRSLTEGRSVIIEDRAIDCAFGARVTI